MKEYIIKEGGHYSNHLPKLYLGLKKNFKLKVQFTESCKYNLGNDNQLDVNKLFGVSFGYHQLNSIRLGWNYDIITDNINLYAYIYMNGIQLTYYIAPLTINTIWNIELGFVEKSGMFWVHVEPYGVYDQNIYKEFYYSFPNIKLGYYLFPYFGGDEVAPHDIKINMDII